MDKTRFAKLLQEMSVIDRNFATRYVTNELPTSFRYFVFLSESYDGNPLKAGEVVFPADADQNGRPIGPLTAESVVDLLWRDDHVPEWIDISVSAADFEHTIFDLRCCGRFAKDDSLLYYSDRGQGPFGLKSPTPPPYWSEEKGRFDLCQERK